jgi:hypothetical protein
MPDQKKFASYALIAIGSAGLIAGTVALKYCSNLSPLIAGGIIGSTPLLIACVGIGVLLLMNKIPLDKIYGDKYDQNSFSKLVIPIIAHVGISFGIGAGLVALGLKSPLAIAVLAPIACEAIMLLFSAITERSSSPPTPPGDPDPSKKDPSSPPRPPEGRERESKPSTKDEGFHEVSEEEEKKLLLEPFFKGYQKKENARTN